MTRAIYTLGDAFDSFQQHSELGTESLKTYACARRHFFAFLRELPFARGLSVAGRKPESRDVKRLGTRKRDPDILLLFVDYLAGLAKRHRLAGSTVRLYTSSAIAWFAFMVEEGVLPDAFPAALAILRAKRRVTLIFPQMLSPRPSPEPPTDLALLIHHFDRTDIDMRLAPKEQRRQGLEALRNRALLYALASSGGRISEILRIDAKDVREAQVGSIGIWSVAMRGKDDGLRAQQVILRFTRPALHAMKEYLEARQEPLAKVLFVSHARTRPAARGSPLSPNAAWRIIQKASTDLGLKGIHPHTFRRWRGTQMLSAGVPIEQVQGYLNHRSIGTTRLYARAVDQAIERVAAITDPF